MFHIIPAFEIWKTVTDKNITSTAAKSRRKAFEKLNELKSITNASIILEGTIFERIKPRLKTEHEKFFTDLYTKDDTGKGVANYDIYSTIEFIAKREAEVDWVIILTENTSRYNKDNNKRIVCITPGDFVAKMVKFKQAYDSYIDLEEQNPQAKEFKNQFLESAVCQIFFGIPFIIPI